MPCPVPLAVPCPVPIAVPGAQVRAAPGPAAALGTGETRCNVLVEVQNHQRVLANAFQGHSCFWLYF